MVFGIRRLFGLASGTSARISPEQARDLILGSNAMVVDVREPDEVRRSGKIAGAVNVPVDQIAEHADPAAPHRDWTFAADRPIIVYCASGIRSARAAVLLSELGYKQVYDLGGFAAWASAGGTVERA